MSKRIFVSFTCIGAAAALGVLHEMPGVHNLTDAKLALSAGALVGYGLGWLLERTRDKGARRRLSLFGTSQLSALEAEILGCIRSQLDASLVVQWDRQVAAINSIQRLPGDIEVNFYRMDAGRPSFDPELAFANKSEDLLLANLEVRLSEVSRKLVARVWCVRGFVFSVEYEGSATYFEEAAGRVHHGQLQVGGELLANLDLAEGGREMT